MVPSWERVSTSAVIDADRDVSDAADKLDAVVQVYRLKSDAELEAETIAAPRR